MFEIIWRNNYEWCEIIHFINHVKSTLYSPNHASSIPLLENERKHDDDSLASIAVVILNHKHWTTNQIRKH